QALTLAKRRLYGNILKALRALHDDISADTLIQNQLSEVEILYNYNLPDQALLVLRKAHELAVRHEKFGLLLQTLRRERRLHIVLPQPTGPAAACPPQRTRAGRTA